MTIRRTRRATTVLVAMLLLSGGLAGCGGGGGGSGSGGDGDLAASADPDAGASSAAADTTLCAADATPIEAPYGEGFPTDWEFPPQTVVYNYENRAGAGTIVTGVSTAAFDTVLDYLNNQEPAAGYTLTGGETEEHDAEADFTVADYSGRWAIRKSATCDGETVVQAVAFAPSDSSS